MIDRRPPPRPTSERSSTRSVRRTAARLTRYWPSPPRCSLRVSETSANGSSAHVPSSLSKTSSTSQKSTGLRPAEPAKRTSSGFSARSSCGLSEPVAQRIESEMFDLPEPFGPTTTATPGSRRTSTGSTNDLNPRSLTAFRYTRRDPSGRHGCRQHESIRAGRHEAHECFPGRVLLGRLLRAAAADAGFLAADDRRRREEAVVRRALGVPERVADAAAAAYDR